MKNFSRFITLTLAAVAFLGGCGKSNDPDTPQKPDEPDQPSAPVYKVGDYYEQGFVKGIVISVDEKGEHGMVVSLSVIGFVAGICLVEMCKFIH